MDDKSGHAYMECLVCYYREVINVNNADESEKELSGIQCPKCNSEKYIIIKTNRGAYNQTPGK